VLAYPKVHEAEEKQVAGDEVACDVCGGCDAGFAVAVECNEVGDLQHEEDEPINAGEGCALREGGLVNVVDLPKRGVLVGAVDGREGVEGGYDEEEEVAESRVDFVEEDGLRRV